MFPAPAMSWTPSKRSRSRGAPTRPRSSFRPSGCARPARSAISCVARHADVVVGFGGYASAPVYSAAHRMGIPVVIHEQNARAGMANKLGARYAAFIGTAYENTGLKPGSGCRMEPRRAAVAAGDQHARGAVRVRSRVRAPVGGRGDGHRPGASHGAGHRRVAGRGQPEQGGGIQCRGAARTRAGRPSDRQGQDRRSALVGGRARRCRGLHRCGP